jgi:hypothetical protein
MVLPHAAQPPAVTQSREPPAAPWSAKPWQCKGFDLCCYYRFNKPESTICWGCKASRYEGSNQSGRNTVHTANQFSVLGKGAHGNGDSSRKGGTPPWKSPPCLLDPSHWPTPTKGKGKGMWNQPPGGKGGKGGGGKHHQPGLAYQGGTYPDWAPVETRNQRRRAAKQARQAEFQASGSRPDSGQPSRQPEGGIQEDVTEPTVDLGALKTAHAALVKQLGEDAEVSKTLERHIAEEVGRRQQSLPDHVKITRSQRKIDTLDGKCEVASKQIIALELEKKALDEKIDSAKKRGRDLSKELAEATKEQAELVANLQTQGTHQPSNGPSHIECLLGITADTTVPEGVQSKLDILQALVLDIRGALAFKPPVDIPVDPNAADDEMEELGPQSLSGGTKSGPGGSTGSGQTPEERSEEAKKQRTSTAHLP